MPPLPLGSRGIIFGTVLSARVSTHLCWVLTRAAHIFFTPTAQVSHPHHEEDRVANLIQEKTRQRDELTAQLRRSFDQDTIDKLALVQNELRRLQKAEDVAATANASADEDCTVTLIRGGKDDQSLRLPVGATLESALEQLGWSAQGFEFKRMVGPGMTEAIKDPSAATFGAGTHEVFVTPKVVGG